jgi:L-threonylcarbamoyladenylate synthase
MCIVDLGPNPTGREPAIEEAAVEITKGGIVAIINETLFGLACDARNQEACRRLCALKGRREAHPLPVQAAAPEPPYWTQPVPAAARKLFGRFSPGPITIVVPADPAIAPEAQGENNTAALRVPSHPVMMAVLREFGGPVACTSANPSGSPGARSAEEVAAYFPHGLAMILTGGPEPAGVASTVVDASAGPARVLREGAIPSEEILRCIEE